MRLATWNCSSGPTIPKLERLEAAGVDVAVVCEAPLTNPRSGPSLLAPATSWVSAGELPRKGVAIAGLTEGVTSLAPRRAGRWTAAASTSTGPAVLGIWSAPAEKGAAGYGAQVVRSLDAYADLLVAGDMIVAGDFNIGQGVPVTKGKDWTGPARARWEALGLVSAYHAVAGERFGDATRATYYHRRKQPAAFHIDYVLVPAARIESVRSVEVGTFEEWVTPGWSDHVPLIVDLDW